MRSSRRSPAASFHERSDGRGEIGVDLRALGEAAGPHGLLALPRENQYRLRPHGCGGLEVAQRVADARHAGEIDAEAVRDLFQEPRPGLAATAVRFLRVRAEEDRVDAPADLRE